LVGTNESLNDLAYKYGFSCGNSFSRAFKKYYGVSPSECRDKFSKIGVEVLTYEKYIWRINEIKDKKNGIKNRSTRAVRN
jgi:AraC-like DNA-binding protein